MKRHRVISQTVVAAATVLTIACMWSLNAAAQTVVTRGTNIVTRTVLLTPKVKPAYTNASTGSVRAWASASCGHPPFYRSDAKSDAGTYVKITKPPTPPAATYKDLSASALAWVDHAKAYASASISAWFDADTYILEVTVRKYEYEERKPCNDGQGVPDAKATVGEDPIVFGSAQYTSYTGETLDPFDPRHDGTHRYAESSLSLRTIGEMVGRLPGPAVFARPDGTRSANRLVLRQYVRAGSHDDPDNISGTLVCDLTIGRAPDGSLNVIWTPGTDTSDFAFSFDKTAAQIKQDILSSFTDEGGQTDLFAARVTMLRDESTMPNMTLAGVQESERWDWGSGNPNAIDLPVKWWQGPDYLGGSRPSSVAMGMIGADDFACAGARPVSLVAARWWGTYRGEPWYHRVDAAHTLPFLISFHDSDGAAHPGSRPVATAPLSVQNVLANRFFVNWMPNGDALYEFNAHLPSTFAAQPGREYFVSIADSVDPVWQWSDSTSAHLDQPSWRQAASGPWIGHVFPDLAFVLMSADAAPPEIHCNAPDTIAKHDAPVCFTATAIDSSDPAPSVEIADVVCYKVRKDGTYKYGNCRHIALGGPGDDDDDCDLDDPATIYIGKAPPTDVFIEWMVVAEDADGNASSELCIVEVVESDDDDDGE